MIGLLQLWFGIGRPVGRCAYAATGLSLMAVKYGADALAVFLFTGRFWSPVSYLHPLFEQRTASLGRLPGPLLLGLAVWTIPFLWIGISMTVRRARDAGLSPWMGLLFFFPVINYFLMLALCLASSASPAPPQAMMVPGDRGLLAGSAAGLLLGVGMVYAGASALQVYGPGLFLATPFMMGLSVALLANLDRRRTLRQTLAAALATLLLALGLLLLSALEGVLCILMALPPAALLAALGALLGRSLVVAARESVRRFAALLLLLPLLVSADALVLEAPLREVVTSMEVAAPPDMVWRMVIAFPPLPAPRELPFRLGIAYPLAAGIEGEGVGATRYCEFSTGPFVEPITGWEPARRLAFDVASQPPTMREISPYIDLQPPHVHDSLRTERGEFRLIALPDGRTRLEGSTWYRLELYPQTYWTLWSDALLHRIHRRVLRHVASEAERAAAAASQAARP